MIWFETIIVFAEITLAARFIHKKADQPFNLYAETELGIKYDCLDLHPGLQRAGGLSKPISFCF